jgi:hypothetical protein
LYIIFQYEIPVKPFKGLKDPLEDELFDVFLREEERKHLLNKAQFLQTVLFVAFFPLSNFIELANDEPPKKLIVL